MSGDATTSDHGGLLSPGELLGERYRIERFLARGGMAEIYLAEDLKRERSVALKALPPQSSADPELAIRFQRELALSTRVSHPNICRLYEIGGHLLGSDSSQMNGYMLYLTMEYLPGETLKQSLQRREAPYRPDEALPIARAMAAGLQVLHEADVIHRDLKTSNVFLVEGERRAVVTDFGISRALDKGSTITEIDTYLGSPLYMAPEQLEGGAITPATDVYAFGLVLYEMVTGTLPFLAPRKLQIIMRRLTEAAEPPSRHAPDLPEGWEVAILRCLNYDGRDRFQSASEVLAALEAA